MKWIQMLAVGTALTLALSTWSAAQPTSRPARDSRTGAPLMQRMQNLLDELQLSDEQRAQVDEVMARAQEKMRELRQEFQDSDLPFAERRQRTHETMKSFHDEIAAMLDEAQRELFSDRIEQWQQQARGPASRPFGGQPGRMQGRGPGMGMGAGMINAIERLENAFRRLELTDEQKEQARAILEDAKGKFDELLEQTEQARGQFRTLVQETRQQLNAVLTPEQRDELRRMMPGGQRRGDGPPGPGPRGNRDRRGGPSDKPADAPESSPD